MMIYMFAERLARFSSNGVVHLDMSILESVQRGQSLRRQRAWTEKDHRFTSDEHLPPTIFNRNAADGSWKRKSINFRWWPRVGLRYPDMLLYLPNSVRKHTRPQGRKGSARNRGNPRRAQDPHSFNPT